MKFGFHVKGISLAKRLRQPRHRCGSGSLPPGQLGLTYIWPYCHCIIWSPSIHHLSERAYTTCQAHLPPCLVPIGAGSFTAIHTSLHEQALNRRLLSCPSQHGPPSRDSSYGGLRLVTWRRPPFDRHWYKGRSCGCRLL